MMTSLTSGLPRRLTWTNAPELRVCPPRVVTFRRSTEAHTPMVFAFAFRDAMGTCTANVCTRVAGEEVLAAAHVADALADRDEVEDRTDVAEERIVTLAGERLRAPTVERRDRLRDEAAVLRGRARPDVVRGVVPRATTVDFPPWIRVTVKGCAVSPRNRGPVFCWNEKR